MLLLLVVFVAALVLEDRELELPAFVAEHLTARAEGALGTELDVGGAVLVAEGKGALRVGLRDAALLAPDGAARLRIDRMDVALTAQAFLRGARAPRAIEVRGAALRIVRRPDGRFDIGEALAEMGVTLGAGGPALGTPAEAVAAIRDALMRPQMETLQSVELTGLTLVFEDMRAGRRWTVRDGEVSLDRTAGRIALALSAEMPDEQMAGAGIPRISLRLTIPDSPDMPAEMSALVDGVPAGAIAPQAPALAWLAPLEAPVSGALIAQVPPDGGLGAIDGTLEIGAGRLVSEGGAGFPLDEARAYFAYRPETSRLRFDALRLATPNALLEAEGHAYLGELRGGLPDDITAQLQVTEARFSAPGQLAATAVFEAGTLDAKLRLRPFALQIGQIALEAEADGAPMAPLRLLGSGRIDAAGGAWRASLDVGATNLNPGRLVRLWPAVAVPKTRAWLAENLLGADVLDTKLGIRLTPGQEADVALSFAFRDAVVRALPELPPIRDGIGFASITDEAFTLTIEEGAITPPAGGPIDLSGSVFRVPDTDQKPPDGEVLWESDGGIKATLSLLDQPPFFLMEKAGRPVDLAEGRARLSGTIGFPIRKGVTLEEVEFDLTGELLDVRSDVLVPGRQLDAERLTLEATPAGLTIGGDGRLDDVPFRAAWRQDFGPDRPPAEVAGTFNLSPAAAAAFAPGLPAGTLRGASEAEVALVLPREAPARIEVTSTLGGLGISIPPVGWSKSPGSVGSFTIEGRLGEPGAPAVFDRVALSAPGLEAEGQLTTAPGGGLDRLTLSQARVGNWFRGSAVLRGRGLGRTPAIAVTGGRADLRRSDFGGGGGGGAGGPLSIALDQLTVAEGVALTGLRADLSTSGGLSGRFTASVNGGPQVEGSIVPRGRGRPALRIQASDAGRVLAAAGAFEEARGGAMLLVLVPDGGPGRYQGELTVEGLRLTAAPGLAAVLNTISVVGLLDQLNGTGLLFSSIQASFRLTPDVVELVSASGVGPSIGISADGYYDLRRERIDIRGVLSPLYALNSIGRVFTREGEGLFGFNYRVSGPSDDPNVAVNPLSVLTPGAFRQIFRASPPQRPGSGQ